jgi:ATP-binding cassette subfamily B (MDR/TAP) protein 1
MYTGERQVGALRRRYLEAVLRQDVGFFDTDARTGDVVFSVSTDTLLVQDAIGEKVTSFLNSSLSWAPATSRAWPMT